MTALGDQEQPLLERAAKMTGLNDFGACQDFRVGLRVLLAAAEDADVAPEQRESLEQEWIGLLAQRLYLAEHRERRPEVAAAVIEAPLVVCGLPRTGTTALVDLLAQDPIARPAQQWEIGNLFPPADPETWGDDPRAAAVQAGFDAIAEVNPLVKLGLHTFGARLPEECNAIMTMDFRSPNSSVGVPLPRYAEWLAHGTVDHPYDGHHMVLQHLQVHGPQGRRWTLKSPFHLFHLPAFLAQYPDARLVQTHRDPAALIPSLVGMYSVIRGEERGSGAAKRTGREVALQWGAGLRRAMAARLDPAVDERVLDISHRDYAADPMGCVRRIYERFELALTNEAAAAMQAWADSPAQHISGVRFTLEEFDLDPEFLQECFGDYRDRYAAYM